MNAQVTQTRYLPIVNIVALVLVIGVNALSNALPLNGRTAGEISDALPSYFTPAGYTFSIWGLIYIGLVGFIVYQALPAQRGRPFLRQIGWWFAANSLLNSAWLFLWHYGYYALSVVVMLAILATLIVIFVRLDIGRRHESLPVAERLLVHAPFALYLGWITVATIANIASVSAHLGWDGFGIEGPTWSAIMMGVAVVLAGLLLFNRRSLAYASVLVWALFGIRDAYPEIGVVANTAVIAAAFIIVLALVGYMRTRGAEGGIGAL